MAELNPRKWRPWRIVLVVSLALNMAVAGIVAGFALKGRQDGGPQRFDLSLGPIGAALSHEDRRAIGQVLRANPDFSRPRRGQTPPAIAAIVSALRAETLNEAELREATAQAGVRVVALQAAVADAFVDRVLLMDADQRTSLADRLETIGSARRQGKR